MASCLSPVNLSAPISSFFTKPADSQGVRYSPFPRADLAAAISSVMRQPRGPPATTTPVRGAPAPVTVGPAPSGWRERAAAGPAEMPTMPPKTPPTPKSAGRRRGGRRAGARSPAHSRSPSVYSASSATADEIPAPYVEEDKPAPATRVYDITYLLCLSASPLVGVTEAERARMEDLVYNHTWRRGPQQSADSRSSSRASSRSSSPAPSTRSRSSSPAPAMPTQRLRRGHRRTPSKLCNTTGSDEDTEL